MNKITNPPCNKLKTTTFIIPDVKRKNAKVVVGGESSRHVDGSGAAPDVGVPLVDQFPLISPFHRRLFLMERREGEWKARAQRLTTSQKLSPLVDLCQLLVGASQRASPLKKQLGVLVSFQRQRLV